MNVRELTAGNWKEQQNSGALLLRCENTHMRNLKILR